MHTFRTRTAFGLAAITLLLGVSACAPEELPTDSAEAPADASMEEAPMAEPVTFTASEYAYDAPATMPGGQVEIELVNAGMQPHAMIFIGMGEGHTREELFEVLGSEDAPVPDWMTFPGGIGGVAAGETASIVMDLDPGMYAVISFESAEGDDTPDFAKGMVHEITVTEPEAEVEAPTADVTIDLDEYAFVTESTLPSGEVTLQLDNVGEQPHEAIFMRLAEGVTADDFIEMMSAPPPGEEGATDDSGAAGDSAAGDDGSDASDDSMAGTPTSEDSMSSDDASDESSEGTTEEGSEGTSDAASGDASEDASGTPEGASDSADLSEGDAAPEMQGPPVSSAGGSGPIDPGRSMFITQNLTPGRYMMICFFPDTEDGVPHLMKGMVKEFTVE